MLETTLSIPQFFNQLSQYHSVDRRFADQPVVPHTIVDDFLPEHLFDAVTTELETFPEERWITKQLKNNCSSLETFKKSMDCDDKLKKV